MQRSREITTETSIDWVVSEYPETVPVFLRWRMHCVGCPVARFESVADACANYQRPADQVLADLRLAVSQAGRPRS